MRYLIQSSQIKYLMNVGLIIYLTIFDLSWFDEISHSRGFYEILIKVDLIIDISQLKVLLDIDLIWPD